KHFKGQTYEVIDTAKHSETLEELVIYRNVENGEMWARPVAMFEETVEANGQEFLRFSFLREK
ncbi:DUF1653 domain-containing protein, partial [Patescibacteria group bacterium]|nr:DUF1653 domain-containing protein [Patescibacteria group bacterium]